MRFGGLEERTCVQWGNLCAVFGAWKNALGPLSVHFWGPGRRHCIGPLFMQCGGRPVCILGAWKNADWG